MNTDDFDYDLPSGSIAQHPAEPRDSCRLMVLERGSGQVDHRRFTDITDYLRDGDVLVVNETRVLPARLHGVRDESGGAVEVLLLRQRYENAWECLVRPGRRLKPGSRIVFCGGRMTGLVVDVMDESGGRLIQFTVGDESFMDLIHEFGEVPLPPYITGKLDDPEKYQTIFARDERSAAAPTAGLHFTAELLARVEALGVTVVPIELDVGLDTFRPVTEDDPTRHHIHTEHFRVPDATALAVNEAKACGNRVVAVGTTSVRALESAFHAEEGGVVETEASTDLFILPGYRFQVVDALVTNFHVPRSTLMMMVCAFAGRDAVMRAYREAIDDGYRLLSFGDAMLIT